jgi:hypothetical protein
LIEGGRLDECTGPTSGFPDSGTAQAASARRMGRGRRMPKVE